MKIIIFLFVLFLNVNYITAQCPLANYTFDSQEDIDNFNLNFPGCVHVDVSLTIEESVPNDITNLFGLSSIETIAENLIIKDNGALQSLEGLHNLVSVGQSIQIHGNDNGALTGLENLYGLNKLQSIGESLIITSNGRLQHLFSLNNLTEITTGDLIIFQNQILEDLSGLESLTAINGNVYIGYHDNIDNLNELRFLVDIGGSLTLNSNTSLASLFSSNNLMGIGDDLIITGNTSLDNISGLQNITSISGKVEIVGTAAVNLDGISNIESIGEYLLISNNQYLDSLFTDNNLNTIGTDLRIIGNSSLEINSGLLNLDTIPYDLIYEDNDNATIFQGFENLEYTGNSITVEDNDDMIDFDGLNSLTYIGGSLTVENNNNLTSFNGLENLSNIATSFNIEGNSSLTSISGLNSLTNIGFDLIIENTSLSSITGFSLINSIGRNIELRNNEQLTNFAGFTFSTINGDLIIRDNDVITDLSGLTQITNIMGQLDVTNNSSLISFNGLNNLSLVDLGMIVRINPNLVDFTGLNNLSTINQFLNVIDNASLVNFNGLNNLNSLKALFLQNNDDMTALSGMTNLTFINGYLTIDGNDGLTDLSGFEGLLSVLGNIIIYDNDQLQNLNGLENLTHMDGYLWISQNDLLTSLSGIDNIDPEDIESHTMNNADLEISYNNLLSECEVTSICELLNIPDRIENIHHNNTGCDNVPEVQTACPYICPEPQSLWVSNVTSNSADLNWSINGSQSLWEIEWKEGSDFIPGTGASSGTATATSIPHNINGLTANTQIYYYIRTDCGSSNYSTWEGSTFWTNSPGPSNDDLCDAIELIVDEACTNAAYNTFLATVQPNEPIGSCYIIPFLQYTVWFKFTAPSTGKVIITTDILPQSIIDTRIALFGETPSFDCNDLTTLSSEIGCNDDKDIGNSLSEIFACVIPGQTYYIQVDAGMLGPGDFCIEVREEPDFTVVSADDNEVFSDNSCIDPEGWRHFYNSTTNEIILSLQLDDIAVIEDDAVSLDPDGTTNAFWANNDPDGFPNVSGSDGAAFMRRKWNVNPTVQPASEVGVRFYYTQDEFDAVNQQIIDHSGVPLSDHDQLNFYKVLTGEDPFNIEPGGVAAGDCISLHNGLNPTTEVWTEGLYSGEHYAEYLVSSFSGGGGGGASGGAALPIDLIKFSGYNSNNLNVLEWIVSDIIEIDKFIIEKSIAKGNEFVEIGIVDNQSKDFNNYKFNFIDYSPKTNNYYRLKVLNKNGIIQRSKIILIEYYQKFNIQSISPIPSQNNVHIIYNTAKAEIIDFKLFDISSKPLDQYKIISKEGSNLHVLDISNLSQGIYFISLQNATKKIIKKIIKI